MSEKLMMAFGALILVCGGSYAVYDFLRAGTVAPGESCFNSAHCIEGECIHEAADISGVCALECGPEGGCEPGFYCSRVDYQAAGNTIENYAAYCVPNAG